MGAAQVIIIRHCVLLGAVVGLVAGRLGTAATATTAPLALSRQNFPKNFVFGTASAAYQYEGEANKRNRGPSIWDTFSQTYPERIADRSNGDIAIDFYNRYKDDIKLMKDMHLDAFRFSISWSRILPHGKRSAGINQEGLDFYSDLIDELKLNGLEPYVTLFHWDAPQALEDEYGGFLSPSIVDDFVGFVDLCFSKFGDDVKHWITFNEPTTFIDGYDSGGMAPGRCSAWVNRACRHGNSAIEPYKVAHHILLAHAAAAQLYKVKYKASQDGKIGITLTTNWFEPYSNNAVDRDAAQRALDFMYGWFMDPITYGDYPRNMRDLVGDRLPQFSSQESRLLKKSYDFLGINYYASYYAANAGHVDPYHVRYSTDSRVVVTADRNNIPIGPQAASSWLYIYPEGLRYLLNYTKDAYENPTIYITENGVDELNNKSLTREQALSDPHRIDYHDSHLRNIAESINHHGVDVRGYFAWSFADNFEWSVGYTVRFGFYYIDYERGLKREAKESVQWFTDFLKAEGGHMPPADRHSTSTHKRPVALP